MAGTNQSGGGAPPARPSAPPPEPTRYIAGPKGYAQNPAWIAWDQQYGSGKTNANPYNPSNQQYSNDAALYGTPTVAAVKTATKPVLSGQKQDKNGIWWNVDQYGNPLSRYTSPATRTAIPLGGGGSSGPAWYEQQQVALDKQRLSDARASEAAAEKASQSKLIEDTNNNFRNLQLQSTYGTINGLAYSSPKGAPIAQALPESAALKEAYAAQHMPDPWAQGPSYGGYTGSTFMNAQQPGLSDATATKAPIPGMAEGGEVPGSTGQPQLIVAHGGEEIKKAPGTPSPEALGTLPGAPFSNPLDPNDPMSGQEGDIHMALNNLIKAAQALVTNPKFSTIAPIPSSPEMSQQDAPESMAMGGTVPGQSMAMPADFQHSMSNVPAYATGGIVPPAPLPYSPVLTGLSGYGATVTPNGTPVVMSAYQRSHLMPSSISGPGGYEDYAKQIAGWSPEDLNSLTNQVTGNVSNLSAPTNWAPIGITPAPAGG